MVIKLETLSRQSKLLSGFGLVELLVSISVMVLVTSVIIARHDAFNGATLLRSQAYEIALQAREMQLLAISAAQASTTGFRNVLGVHFSTTTDDSYGVFRDGDGDYFFDAGAEELGKQGSVDRRFQISAIRMIGSVSTPTQLSVLFERPNFDARFYTGPGTPAPGTVSAVEIDVRVRGTSGSGPGEVRTIEITKSGQITVQDI